MKIFKSQSVTSGTSKESESQELDSQGSNWSNSSEAMKEKSKLEYEEKLATFQKLKTLLNDSSISFPDTFKCPVDLKVFFKKCPTI